MIKRSLCIASVVLLTIICMVHDNFSSATKKREITFSKTVSKIEIGFTFSFKIKGVKNDGKSVK